MSMIRDLRAVVRPSRPSLRKGGLRMDTGAYDTTRDPSTPSAVVDCAVYRDGARVESAKPLTPQEAMRLVRRDGGFVWIGLHEPTESEFAGIASEFGLHPLAVEDAVQAHQRPKLERYDDSLFTVFKTIHYVEHDQLTATSEVVETGEVMCFTGRDFFITVRHGGQGSLRALRPWPAAARARRSAEALRRSARPREALPAASLRLRPRQGRRTASGATPA